MAITVETRTDIIELIVGMVGAAPGAAILSELAEIVDSGLSLNDLAIALANNPAFKTLYPSFLTSTEFATNFLTNLMGSEVDATTLSTSVDAMVADLNSGTHRGAAMYTAITTLGNTAETDANFGAAAAALNNKTEVAVHYSVTTQQSADTLDELKAVVSQVTSSEATVTTAKASIDGQEAAGQTYNLTTAIDTIVGTDGNDTINGTQSGTAASNNYQLADTIDGGAGTDTLILTSDQAAAVVSSTVKNVEKLVYRAAVAGGDLAMSNFTSVTDLTLDRLTGATNVTALNKADAVTILSAPASMDTTLTYSSVSGLTDAATVTLAGTSLGGDIEFSGAVETMNIVSTATSTLSDLVFDAGTTTINFNAGAPTTVFTTFTATGATKLTAAGSSALSVVTIVPALANTILTVDSSAQTAGGLTTTLGTGATLKYTGGAGADKVTTGAVMTTGNIDGGAGSDTLTIANSTHLTALIGAKFTNFETLGVLDAVTVDMDHVAGLTGVIVTDGAGATTVNDLSAAQAANVTLKDVEGAITLAVKGAATVGQLDTITITVSDGDSTTSEDLSTTAMTATINNVETINFVAVDDVEVAATTAMTDWSTINISGAGNTNLVTGAAALVINSKISASAATGAVVIDASAGTTNGIAITGGAGADTLTGTDQADVVVGGAGKDTIDGEGGIDTLTGGTEADTFVFVSTESAANSTADSITDFEKGVDIISQGTLVLSGDASTTAAAANAAISSEGIATFVAADDTLAEKVTAVNAALEAGTEATGQVAIFEHSGSSYVYIYDDTADTVAAEDTLIKLTGVTGLTDSTITAGNLTIA